MHSLLHYTLLFALMFGMASAFTVVPQNTVTSSSYRVPNAGVPQGTPSALYMARPKIDPKMLEKKEEKFNPAVFKNIAYLGSVAVALLLPIIFLVASK